MYRIVTLETPSLGDRSYLVHDGSVALVVDPQRDVERVLAAARDAGVRITHVVETHMHNDYVTGGLELARRTGAQYLVSGDDAVEFERTPIRDGDLIEVSPSLRVRVAATPGHTFTHLSYVLEVDGEPRAVFTGGSLLYGSTGRTDLVAPEHTETLTHAQYASAQRLAGELPASTEIFPTHGFGSFCSATQTDGSSSTIGQERQVNPAYTLDEPEFVKTLLAGLDAYPAYYAQMGPRNLAGPSGADLRPPEPADPAELRRRLDAGEWVVDLRSRTAYAAGHLPRSLYFGLDGSFVTYLGWLVPWGTPVTLLGETPEQVAEAQTDLARIGIDRPAAVAVGGPEDWSDGTPLSSLRTATFRDLAARHGEVSVLDVRRRQEYDAGHIAGAIHLPLHELPGRLGEIPDSELWVHCAGGYRATVAASLLDAAGRQVVVIDDEFDNAAAAGLPIVEPAGVAA